MRQVGWLAGGATVAMTVCLVVPLLVVVVGSFNPTNELMVPPGGVSLRWYANVFQRPAFLSGFWFSLELATAATMVSLVIGLLAAVALVRRRFRGRELLATLLLSPLIVPQVVLGMSLLLLLSRLGIVSSTLGLGVLHVILTLPYTVRVLSAALSRFPVSLEEAAVVHGAPRPIAFVLVTLPGIKAGVVTAAIFAFVTSFDNFTATQFLTWDRTTLPVEIYSYIRTENDPTVAAISTLLILGTIAVVLVAERWVGLDTFTG